MLISTLLYEILSYLIFLIFIALAVIAMRKKKKRRGVILMISPIVLFLCSFGLLNKSGTLYVINEDYSCTTYHVFGKASMKFDSEITMKSKSLEYVIDPDPGKIMVLNRSFIELRLTRVPYEIKPNDFWEDVKIEAYTTKKFDLPGIDYFPKDVVRGPFVGYRGTNILYWLTKNN